jgi:hypothetical protein
MKVHAPTPVKEKLAKLRPVFADGGSVTCRERLSNE